MRWVIRGGLALLGLLGLLAVGIGTAGWWLMGTDQGRQWLVTKVESAAAAAGTPVTLEGLGGRLPGHLTLDRVTVADGEGVWLSADKVSLAWRPAALISGRIAVETLAARTVHVRRPPVGKGQTDPQTRGLPTWPAHLPVAATLRDLHVDTVVLDPPVVGQAARLSVHGSLDTPADGPDVVRARLTVDRIDDHPGTVTVQGGLGRDETLAVAARLSEPAGGLLATAANLPGTPPVSLTLKGRGPLSQWQGTLSASAEDLITVHGPISGSPEAVSTTLTVRPGPTAPPSWTALMGTETTLDLGARFGDGAVTVDPLTVAAPAWRLAGTATVGETLAGDLSLTVRDGRFLEALAPVTLRHGQVTATLAGTPAAPQVTVHGDVKDVGAPGRTLSRVRLDGTVKLTDGRPTVTARARVEGLETLVPVAKALPEPLPVAARVIGRPDGSYDVAALRLGDDATHVAATGTIRGSHVTATVSARLPRLGALVPPGVLADPYGPVILTAPVQVRNGVITVHDLKATAPGLSLGGQATVDPGRDRLTAGLVLRDEDLHRLMPRLQGRATLDVTATGRLSDPDVILDLDLPTLTVGGTRITEGTLSLRLTRVVSKLAGTLSLAATVPLGPVALDTGFATAGGLTTLTLHDLKARLAGLDAQGEARVDLTRGLVTDGQVRLRAADLGTLVPGLAGAADLTVRPSTPDGRQALAVDGTATDLRQGALAVRQLRLTGDARDVTGTPRLDATLSATGVSEGGRPLAEAASVTVAGSLADLAFGVQSQGTAHLDAAGRAVLGGDRGPVMTLNRFNARYDPLDLRLSGPAELALTPQGPRVSGLDLAVNDGRLRLDGGQGANGYDLTARVDNVPLSLVRTVAPQSQMQGRLNGDVQLRGQSGRVALAATGVRFGNDQTAETATLLGLIPALSLRVAGDLTPTGVDTRLTLAGLEKAEPLEITARLPVRWQGGLPLPRPEGPLSAQVDWETDLSVLETVLPGTPYGFGGALSLKGAVGGTLARPRPSVTLRGRDLLFADHDIGLSLHQGTLDVALTRDRRIQADLRFRDYYTGRATFTADGQLTENNRPQLNGRLQIHQVRVADVDWLTGDASADVRYQGTLPGGTLRGRVDVGRVALSPLDMPGSAGDPLAGVVIVDESALVAGEVPAQEENDGAPVVPMILDLTIDAPNRLFVYGPDFMSEWKMALTVGGVASAPRLNGRIQVVRGDFSVLGKPFNIATGIITFRGWSPPNPDLNIIAENDTDALTAQVVVSGNADSPEVKLQSDPDYPEDEIVSQVLFGQSLSELGPGAAIAAAQAVSQLTGKGGGGPSLNVVGDLRRGLGLDVLRFGGSSLDDTTVEAGKYLTRDLYVGVEQGVTSNQTTVSAEYDLTPELKLEGRTTPEGGGSLGILWRHDY